MSQVRVQPHDLGAEEAFIGATLLNVSAIDAGVDVGLEPGDFYKPAHGIIWTAVKALWERGHPVDTVTAIDELSRDGLLESVGGAPVLSSLMAGTPAISNAGRYAAIVRD